MTRSPENTIACVALGFGIVASAHAGTITTTFEGFGSGTLDGIPFAIAYFKITCIGDTIDRVPFEVDFNSGFYIDNAAAQVEISRVDTVVFKTPTRVFVNNTLGVAGFSRADLESLDLVHGPPDQRLTSWNMLSSIGPIGGRGSLRQWDLDPLVETSGGVLIFDADDTQVSFQAITKTVPCPADIDDDGQVGFADLIELLASWGPCVACPADFDASGEVDFDDLLTLLFEWGPCG